MPKKRILKVVDTEFLLTGLSLACGHQARVIPSGKHSVTCKSAGRRMLIPAVTPLVQRMFCHILIP